MDVIRQEPGPIVTVSPALVMPFEQYFGLNFHFPLRTAAWTVAFAAYLRTKVPTIAQILWRVPHENGFMVLADHEYSLDMRDAIIKALRRKLRGPERNFRLVICDASVAFSRSARH